MVEGEGVVEVVAVPVGVVVAVLAVVVVETGTILGDLIRVMKA